MRSSRCDECAKFEGSLDLQEKPTEIEGEGLEENEQNDVRSY